MFSRLADVLVPTVGRLTVTVDAGSAVVPGSIIAANHTSLADPAVVLAALHRLGVQPVAMGAAGLWRIPLLGRALTREGHIPVYPRDPARRRRARSRPPARAGGRPDGPHLDSSRGAVIPLREDAAEAAPEPFPQRSRPARRAHRRARRAGRPGRGTPQSPPATRPSNSPGCSPPLCAADLHVQRFGDTLTLAGGHTANTRQAHAAVTAAWRTAAAHLGEPAALAA